MKGDWLRITCSSSAPTGSGQIGITLKLAIPATLINVGVALPIALSHARGQPLAQRADTVARWCRSRSARC